MNKDEITVFVRIALYALSGYLVSGGWLPDEAAEVIKYDPALVEMTVAAVTAIGTLLWYYWSKARKALMAVF